MVGLFPSLKIVTVPRDAYKNFIYLIKTTASLSATVVDNLCLHKKNISIYVNYEARRMITVAYRHKISTEVVYPRKKPT